MDDSGGHYAALHVPSDASPAEIRRSYLALALELHPDKCNGRLAERFHHVQDAYRVLSDPVQRAEYDALSAFAAPAAPATPSPWSSRAPWSSCAPSSSHTSWSTRAPSSPRAPDPTVHVVQVAARDVRLGRPDLVLDLALDVECPACASRRTCRECAGAGAVVHSLGGGLDMCLTCIACTGTGQAFGGRLGCRACRDTGVTREVCTFRIPVPRGVRDDQVLRLPGQGAFDPATRTRRDMCLRFRRALPAGTRVLNEEEGDVEVRVRVSLGECLTGVDRLAVDVLGHPVVLRAAAYFDPTRPVVLPGRGLPRRQPEDGIAASGAAVLRFDVAWPDSDAERDRTARNLRTFRAALRKMMRVDRGRGGRPDADAADVDATETVVDLCAISASATS